MLLLPTWTVDEIMARLSAVFSICQTSPIIVECKNDQVYSYSLVDGEHHVKIYLPLNQLGPISGFAGSDLYKRTVDWVEITVTKDVGDVPAIPINEHGGRDLYKVGPYYNGICDGFREVAERYYKRLIRFIKYELKQPFQDDELINPDFFSNPCWVDEDGKEIGVVSPVLHVQPIPGMDGQLLGSESLKAEHLLAVENELKVGRSVELYQEILSDAQAAIFGNDVRRAVFELAVVCELAVKRKYFSEGVCSGLAFDYFEDKGLVKVTVIELISKVAEEALGESYRKHSAKDYSNIDYLIRCRNKVAHRGQVLFKDDGGKTIQPDLSLVKEWFESVENLLAWLATK